RRDRRHAARRVLEDARERRRLLPRVRSRARRGDRHGDCRPDPRHGAMTLGALVIHKRTLSGCVQNDGFCPSWIVHHLHRYEHPLLQHVYLTVTAVVIGFALAVALALVAYQRRWLIASHMTV